MAIISYAVQYILVAFLFVRDFYSIVFVNGSSNLTIMYFTCPSDAKKKENII